MGFQSANLATWRGQILQSKGTREWIAFLVILMSFWVTPEAHALQLQVSPTSLSFTGVQGGANPANQALSFYKKNSVLKSWSVTDSAPWLSLTPTSGTISTETEQVTVSVNMASLSAGAYQATITITLTAPNGGITTQLVPVSLNLAAPPTTSSTINLNPSSLTFSGVQGGTNPSPQQLSITNTGGGTMNWAVSDTATWLTLSPASGTAPGSTTASVNLTGLTTGTYNATITATASGATNSPQTVPVTLTVTATPPTIGLSPTSLTFSGTQGSANPAAKAVSITNAGGGTLSWTVSDNAAWLSLSPASGTAPGSATANVSLAGLVAGTYNATITIAATEATNTPQTVPVTLTVTSPVTSSATLTWTASPSSGVVGYKVYMGTASGVYGPPTSVGNATMDQILNLTTGQTYYFSVTAVDTLGNESIHSNEVSKSIY